MDGDAWFEIICIVIWLLFIVVMGVHRIFKSDTYYDDNDFPEEPYDRYERRVYVKGDL